ncbi:MAG: hypothetical protein ACLQVL_35595 [Terriglobia bacterium]
MPNVSTYWPGNFWQAMNQSLAWLYGRQSSPNGNWLANALLTQGAASTAVAEEPTSGLVECGLSLQINFLTGLTVSGAQEPSFPMSQIESIVAALPPGLWADNQLGPDGYPVNESGMALPWGNLLVNSYEVTTAMEQSIGTLLYNANSTWITPGLPQTPGVIAKWTANTNYPFGSLIVDSNNNVQMALYNGATANTSNPPNWPTTLGARTGDNTQLWKLIALGYQNAYWVATGYAFNLLNAQSSYRVDVFVHTDVWYYQGSSGLQTTVPIGGGAYAGGYTWSLGGVRAGMLLAALYPTSVAPPASGWSGSTIPAGWVAHTNTGVCQTPQAGSTLGGKLTNYKAQIYVKTDLEYLQEDNIPIIVQSDGFHARAGSSVIVNPESGIPTVHILYNDPVVGWTEVFDSLGSALEYSDLPRSFDVPTSDPLFVPNPGATDLPAMQNRSYIYDCALAIIAYTSAGNFTAAEKIINQLNAFLATPGYLASAVLENAEDGSTARWSVTGAGGTVSNIAANSVVPEEPPYGTGNILDFHAGSANDVFTYVGSGFPDSTDSQLSFEHMEAPGASFVFDISVLTTQGLVTDVQVSSGTAGPATLAGTVITLPIGPGATIWRTTLLDLKSQISNLTADTLVKITGFRVTLTAADADLYFDNLSVGSLQPANSLSFSYDTFNGQVDQAYIRAGAMAWVVYAYCVYMQLSQDFSSVFALQGMINFLLTLQSTAADLTNGLFYEGYGSYQNPGYQFIPGLVRTVSTEHQIDLWFAFQRAANVLPTSATFLSKTQQITSAQAGSLVSTAGAASAAAAGIDTNLITNLYIAPSGVVPGHFAQGVTGSALDTSQALDASGHWAALWAHASGRDDIALECAEFAYTNFLVVNQTVALSSQANSYNEAFEVTTPFTGMKPYNDSPGGYSGSPASVWQEGTWGMILMLLDLYNISGLAGFFTGLGTTIDAALTTLVAGQATLLQATGNGSLLAYSLASRGLPYEFEVWPALAPTAWMWVVATNPSLLLTVAGLPQLLPYMYVPAGAEQSIDDKNGSSSVGQMEIRCIDPGGVLHTLAAQAQLIGQVVTFSMGFPGSSLGDFVPLHVMQISEIGFDTDGRVILKCADLKRFVQGAFLWANGGPEEYLPGQQNTWQPVGAQWLANSYPVSSDNPRWIAGNPLDIFLAAMQNELGVGQDLALSAVVEESGTGELIAAVNPFWAQYVPTSTAGTGGNPATLINPNPYLDVPGITALRDTMFSGDWFEFKITSPQQGRSWLEDQILKPLGLVMVVASTGQLTLKPMKNPLDQTPVAAFTPNNIVGIPAVSLAAVINALTFRGDVDNTATNTSARTYNSTVAMLQQASYNLFRYLYNHQVEATGLVMARGISLRAFLLGDQLFRRYGFATPVYQIVTQLGALQPELKDWVSLTHPLVPDYIGGGRGVTNIPCEIIGRSPNYSNGQVRFTLLDMRRASTTSPYEVVPAASMVLPPYAQATESEQETYFFITPSANGVYTEALSTIF